MSLGIGLLAAASAVPAEPPDPIAARFNAAVDAFNAGRMVEARSGVEALLLERPDYYRAYHLYWSALGRVEDAAAQRKAVMQAVAYFDRVPAEARDEAYYTAFLEACRILKEDARAAALTTEAAAKFPRGRIAQKVALDAAQAEPDPAKQVAMLDAWLADFGDNVSWSEIASHDRLRTIIDHPEIFDVARLRDAADQAEQREKRFIEMFGQPVRYVLLTVEIADALVQRDPALALVYTRKGLSFIQEQWPAAEADFESLRFRLWPGLMSAHVALEQWPAARAVGDALSREVDAERLLLTPDKEAAFRRTYASALDRTGGADEARRQRELAADPEAARRAREERARRELLAGEQRRPAPAFALKDLSGKTIRSEDFRGRVLVLTLWATWCGPCVRELDELKASFVKHGSNPKVAFAAVSIDSDKDVVPPFVAERGYAFPILLSDGTVEAPFGAQSIPRLFVIDRKGLIRFEATGMSPDGRFGKRLDWMIEAASK